MLTHLNLALLLKYSFHLVLTQESHHSFHPVPQLCSITRPIPSPSKHTMYQMELHLRSCRNPKRHRLVTNNLTHFCLAYVCMGYWQNLPMPDSNRAGA